MGRAYGQLPSAALGLQGELPDIICLMLDAAAHEIGGVRLSEAAALKRAPMGVADAGSY